MPAAKRYAAAAFLIGFAVCAVDAASKAIAVAALTHRQPAVLIDGLVTLQLYRNPGAAFSIGPSDTVIFALVAVGVVVAILRLSARLRSWPWAIALGLILGGAAGNLMDRIFRSPGALHGLVVDWIKLAYFPWTFNIADSAITVGVALVVLASVRGWRLDGTGSRAGAKIRPVTADADAPPT